MVKDQQVRKIMELISEGKPLYLAAIKAGMDKKTARKYLHSGKLPSECAAKHTWRTRDDPFSGVWDEVRGLLEINPGLQGNTIFNYLQERYPGRFSDGQLRTLQRKLKVWHALEGPAKEVFFPQEHHPGVLCASDFCDLSKLDITICGEPFPHLLYHMVLTYSNWETGSICFSESFESLSMGLQQALWELGAVPLRHRTDSLSAAVRPPGNIEEFTLRYQALLSHYDLEAEHTNSGQAHENGDVEQRHYRFQIALDQALMLRGSRDFANRTEYDCFLRQLFLRLNSGRQARLQEERPYLKPLPSCRLDSCKQFRIKVGPSSTVRVKHNVYSVHSRLLGEWIEVRLFAEHLQIWYAQKMVDSMPRLRGEYRVQINYRHLIDWLVRKPGAFANYRYREGLFPTSRFRMAYDELVLSAPGRAEKEYLKILHLAARDTEQGVDDALGFLLENKQPISADVVEEMVSSGRRLPPATAISIDPVNLNIYDGLLKEEMIYA